MSLFFYIIFLHWIGDFVFQSDRIANNKSKNLGVLTDHCIIYTFILLLGLTIWFLIVGPFTVVTYIALICFTYATFTTHFITDFFTSKVSEFFWKEENHHAFFVTIGFDQMIHYLTLGATASYFLHT